MWAKRKENAERKKLNFEKGSEGGRGEEEEEEKKGEDRREWMQVAVKTMRMAIDGDAIPFNQAQSEEKDRSNFISGEGRKQHVSEKEISPHTQMRKSIILQTLSTSSMSPGHVDKLWEDLSNEVWLMSGIRHPYIVQLVGVSLEPPAMVLEAMPGGDLYMQLNEPLCDVHLIVQLMRQVLQAVGRKRLKEISSTLPNTDKSKGSTECAGDASEAREGEKEENGTGGDSAMKLEELSAYRDIFIRFESWKEQVPIYLRLSIYLIDMRGDDLHLDL